MEEQLFPQAGQQAGLQTGAHAGSQPGAVPGQKAPLPGVGALQLGNQITSIATRLKLVEERYANLAKRNQLTEGSLMSFEHEAKTELRVLTTQMMALRKRITEINAKLDAIGGEMGSVVRKHEFAVAERYLEMWQPMQFISREEARRMLDEAIAARSTRDGKDSGDSSSTAQSSSPISIDSGNAAGKSMRPINLKSSEDRNA